MVVHYYQDWASIELFGEREEIESLPKHLLATGTVIKCEPANSINESSVLDRICFEILPDGLVTVGVKNREVHITGGFDKLKLLSQMLEKGIKHLEPPRRFSIW